jgi:hypothetical protein
VFDLFSFLSKLLSGIDVDSIEEQGRDWLATKGLEYPDLKDKTDALASFLSSQFAAAKPELDPAKIAATVKALVPELLSGETGVDPNAGHGVV